MATSIPLDPLAADKLKELVSRLESEEGHDASQRRIVNALVWGATAPQAAGMLIAFTRARKQAQAEAEQASDDDADTAPPSS